MRSKKKYVEWAIQKPRGIFLITWPWPDVRFLPVLLTEYCISFPDEKIVVIGDYDRPSKEKKTIDTPSLCELLKKTVFIDNPAPSIGRTKERNDKSQKRSLSPV
jgi:hypothetical protein